MADKNLTSLTAGTPVAASLLYGVIGGNSRKFPISDTPLVAIPAVAPADNALVRWDGVTGRFVQTSAAILSDNGGLSMGGSDKFAYLYNLVDDLASPTNYERGAIRWESNIFKIGSQNGGAGTGRATWLMGATVHFTSIAGTIRWEVVAAGHLRPGGNNSLDLGESTQAVRTGYFATSAHIAPNTAVPAGGTAGLGVRFSSTANLGVFFGSGVPTLAAAKGSIYLRTDGSGVSDRAYINTDGSTTWTAIATAA